MPSVLALRFLSPLPRPRRRRRLRALCAVALGAAVLAWTAPAARADTIPVKFAELRIEEGEVLLNAEFEFTLNPTLEEALQSGIPLYFILEFELTRGRWYWFDEKVGADRRSRTACRTTR